MTAFKRTFFVLMLLVIPLQLFSQDLKHVSLKYQGLEREYWLLVPDSLDPRRPLVILLHGYGGTADGYRPEMVQCAREKGFVLCIPQGFKDPEGSRSWNVGYPSQRGMKTDDVAFIEHLAKSICRKYSLDRGNVFLTGMSNGGEMCYLMACVRPKLFKGIASVAGLTMEWIVKQKPLPSVPVAFMEIHGTKDVVSMWEGDPDNTGGWGTYTSVPEAMGRIVAAARCTHQKSELLPKLKEDSHQIVLHRYLGGGRDVLLYEVEGGVHSWFLDDIDTVGEIWRFFDSQMKCN